MPCYRILKSANHTGCYHRISDLSWCKRTRVEAALVLMRNSQLGSALLERRIELRKCTQNATCVLCTTCINTTRWSISFGFDGYRSSSLHWAALQCCFERSLRPMVYSSGTVPEGPGSAAGPDKSPPRHARRPRIAAD